MKLLSLLFAIFFIAPQAMADSAQHSNHRHGKSWKLELNKQHHHHGKDGYSHKHRRSKSHKGNFFLYSYGINGSGYLNYGRIVRKPVYVEKRVQPVIVQQPVVVQKKIVKKTRYVNVEKQPSATLCSGDTVYYRDRNTGELVIRYITPPKECR